MKDGQRGQVLLIIVLIMVVALTVSLSVASRSIINIRTTTEEENSQRAFSAAEAGVERALKIGQGVTGSGPGIELDNDARIKQVDVTPVGGSAFVFKLGNPLPKDDGVDIWLANHDENGKIIPESNWSGALTIFWGMSSDICSTNVTTNTMAALEIIVFSGDTDAPVTTRYTADPCTARVASNNFSSVSGGGQAIAFAGKTTNFTYGKTLSITNGMLVRAVPIYATTPIGVRTSSNLPSQGKQIESTGQSADTFRKVSYFQGYPKCPSEFCQYVLFVPKSL